MEKLDLKVLQCASGSTSPGTCATFGMAGGTIGKGGQNKLILPCTDGTVARVHAMVRLDHGGAYIANLSESKPIWVGEQLVQSGQEVQLPLLIPIRIGSYTLHAEPCGQMHADATNRETRGVHIQHEQKTPSSGAMTPYAVTAQGSDALLKNTSQSELSPADMPSNEASLGDLLPLTLNQDEGGILSLLGSTQQTNGESATGGISVNQATQISPQSFTPESINCRPPLPLTTYGEVPAPQLSSPGQMHQPASSASLPAQIPDDFNPFASTIETEHHPLDGWASAGLRHVGSADVSFTKVSDELVRDLPLQGQFEHAIDDPSHSGLPKQYASDPSLDPLALFGGEGIEIGAFETTQAIPHGSELAQAFNLPRTQVKAEIRGTQTGLLTAVFQPEAARASQPDQFHQTNTERNGVKTLDPAASNTTEPKNSQATTATSSLGPAHPMQTTHRSSQEPPAEKSLAALAAAFMKGAGLDPAKTNFEVTPEFMRTFGEVLRIAVQGTIDLLAARSEIKREFRAGVTIIASGANNPLKFLPNAEGVIMQMTNKTFPGFMPPGPAMEEAFADLRVHQFALMAGIRAAYAEALARFDPTELERRGEGGSSLIDKLLINGRKAALWDDYKHNFEALRQHAEDDLMAFSGRSFLDAYEQAAHTAKDSQGSSQ